MQQLKTTLGNELRDLAAELRRAVDESPAMSIAAPIVAVAADHLCAVARNIDNNGSK